MLRLYATRVFDGGLPWVLMTPNTGGIVERFADFAGIEDYARQRNGRIGPPWRGANKRPMRTVELEFELFSLDDLPVQSSITRTITL